MYETLVKSLRDCADDSCEKCAYLKHDEDNCFVKFCGILREAADAIEELSRQLTEYHRYDGFLMAHGCFTEPPKEET